MVRNADYPDYIGTQADEDYAVQVETLEVFYDEVTEPGQQMNPALEETAEDRFERFQKKGRGRAAGNSKSEPTKKQLLAAAVFEYNEDQKHKREAVSNARTNTKLMPPKFEKYLEPGERVEVPAGLIVKHKSGAQTTISMTGLVGVPPKSDKVKDYTPQVANQPSKLKFHHPCPYPGSKYTLATAEAMGYKGAFRTSGSRLPLHKVGNSDSNITVSLFQEWDKMIRPDETTRPGWIVSSGGERYLRFSDVPIFDSVSVLMLDGKKTVEYKWSVSARKRHALMHALNGNILVQLDPRDYYRRSAVNRLLEQELNYHYACGDERAPVTADDLFGPLQFLHFITDTLCVNVWAISSKMANKLMHALNGNVVSRKGQQGTKPFKSHKEKRQATRNAAVSTSVQDGLQQLAAAQDIQQRFATDNWTLGTCDGGDLCVGDSCILPHELQPLKPMPLRPSQVAGSTAVCWDFQNKTCTRKKCKYAHVAKPPKNPRKNTTPSEEPGDESEEAVEEVVEEKSIKKPKTPDTTDKVVDSSCSLKHFRELVKNHYFTAGTGDKEFKAAKGKLAWWRQSVKPPMLTHDTMEACRQIIIDERALYFDKETVSQKAAVIRNRLHDSLKDWVATPLAFIPAEMSGVTYSEYVTVTDGCVGPLKYEPVEKPNKFTPAVEHKTVASKFSFGMTLFADLIWMPRTNSSYNAEDGMRMRQLLPVRSTHEARKHSYDAGVDALVADWGGVEIPDDTLENKRETFLNKYPQRRRQCIAAWAEPLDKSGYYDNRSIADVKREWLFRKPVSKNNPRIITTHHESQLLLMGPEAYHEFKHRKRALFGDQEWVKRKHIIVGGMDAVKIGDIVTFNEARGYFAYESDGSRWDGRTEKEGLQAEIAAWRKMGMADNTADYLALNIDTKGRVRAGGKYSTEGKRDSGTINTSDGNGAEGHIIDAGVLNTFPFNEEDGDEVDGSDSDTASEGEEPEPVVEILDEGWMVGEPHEEPIDYMVVRNGDDMMAFTSRKLTTLEILKWERHYTNCGHKAPVFFKEYDDLEFNGGMFPRIGSGQRVWAPYIAKMCAKLFMPKHRDMTKAEVEDHIYGVANGMKHYTFLPILGPILAAILTGGRVAKTIERDEYKCSLREGLEVDKEEVYDYYNARYGIDVGVYDFLRHLPFWLPYRAWNIPGLEVVARRDGIMHDDPADLDVQFEVLDGQQNFIQQWKNAAAPAAVAATAFAASAVDKVLPKGKLSDTVTTAISGFMTDTDVGVALSAAAAGDFKPAGKIADGLYSGKRPEEQPDVDAAAEMPSKFARAKGTIRRQAARVAEIADNIRDEYLDVQHLATGKVKEVYYDAKDFVEDEANNVEYHVLGWMDEMIQKAPGAPAAQEEGRLFAAAWLVLCALFTGRHSVADDSHYDWDTEHQRRTDLGGAYAAQTVDEFDDEDDEDLLEAGAQRANHAPRGEARETTPPPIPPRPRVVPTYEEFRDATVYYATATKESTIDFMSATATEAVLKLHSIPATRPAAAAIIRHMAGRGAPTPPPDQMRPRINVLGIWNRLTAQVQYNQREANRRQAARAANPANGHVD